MRIVDVQNDNIRLTGAAAKAGPLLAIVGLVFLGLSVLFGGGDIFWKSYLFAWIAALGICLGALFFVLLQHLTRSGWSVSVRRIAEGVAKNLSWMWMLFVPILILILSGNVRPKDNTKTKKPFAKVVVMFS